MENSNQPEYNTLEYWKEQAKHYENKAKEIQQELDEYTESSAQLEKELEASLMQEEKQKSDLLQQNQRLKKEIELLRNKLERSQQESNVLEDELVNLKVEKEKQAVYVRELEQKNDDLERAQRVISESVSYIEALLNQAYERNAELENEVDEVETLRERLQRATDEARDLKQELKVIERIPPLKKEEECINENNLLNGHTSKTTRAQVETETQTLPSTPQKREINGNAMTPSARVSAINIVGDLLRKVGLERFLCRECGNVKCVCHDAATRLDGTAPSVDQPRNELKKSPSDNGNDTDIEYRSKTLTRQLSDEERINTSRYSEQPFTRSSQGEGGKLRRSFAVRSREGIENLLSFGRNRNHNTAHDKLVRPKQ